jgi:hypothetical protein
VSDFNFEVKEKLKMEGPINLESKDNHNIIKYNSHFFKKIKINK